MSLSVIKLHTIKKKLQIPSREVEVKGTRKGIIIKCFKVAFSRNILLGKHRVLECYDILLTYSGVL